MNEILPNLYLSSYRAAQTYDGIHETFVVNCTKDLPMLSVKNIRVPVDDDCDRESIYNMLAAFPAVTDGIHTKLTASRPVVVHCQAGQQRSPTVVCAYMMRYAGYELHDAIRHIRSRRPEAFFWEVNFRYALERYAEMIDLANEQCVMKK